MTVDDAAKPDFGLVLTTCCRRAEHLEMLAANVESARRTYPGIEIVVIDDHSPLDPSPLAEVEPGPRVEIVRSELSPGVAELLPYWYLVRRRLFPKALVLHDSMCLVGRPAGTRTVTDVAYVWHFTCHHDWAAVMEPTTDFNVERGIVTHDDLIRHHVRAMSPRFRRWVLGDAGAGDGQRGIYEHKERWVGCFGTMSLITLEFLDRVAELTGLLELAPRIRDRRDRMALECIFPLACQFAKGEDVTTSLEGPYRHGGNGNRGRSASFSKQAHGR